MFAGYAPIHCLGFGALQNILQHARPSQPGACVASIVIPRHGLCECLSSTVEFHGALMTCRSVARNRKTVRRTILSSSVAAMEKKIAGMRPKTTPCSPLTPCPYLSLLVHPPPPPLLLMNMPVPISPCSSPSTSSAFNEYARVRVRGRRGGGCV